MVMDETYVINQVKEDVCYVSSQFMEDMDIAKWVRVWEYLKYNYTI